ncbi:MAG: hypothetical protein JSR73_09105 [Proteobacteria bacterium]|nr:hypothetical protein [Pseudomonadota bacterium]
MRWRGIRRAESTPEPGANAAPLWPVWVLAAELVLVTATLMLPTDSQAGASPREAAAAYAIDTRDPSAASN